MARLPASPRALMARLRKGGLIAYPTRASFGLGCLPLHAQALRKLTRLKRRPLQKGLIVVADQFSRLQPLIQPLTQEHSHKALEKWPGNWTWLIPAHPRVPLALKGKSPSIAVRVDAYPPLRGLCQTLKTALVSTSANRSGHKPIQTEREIKKQFGQAVTVISGRCQKRARASTIADLQTGKILRS